MKCGMPGKPAGKQGTSFRKRRRVFTSPLRSLAKKTEESPLQVALH